MGRCIFSQITESESKCLNLNGMFISHTQSLENVSEEEVERM